MRRPTRLGLAALGVLLLLVAGYAGFWLIAAKQIEAGFVDWAAGARHQGIDASWRNFAVGGFPTAFRIDLAGAELRDTKLIPAPGIEAPLLSGSARPWDFHDWRLTAPRGFSAELPGAGARPAVRLEAQKAAGEVAFGGAGGATLTLRLDEARAKAGGQIRVRLADLRLTLPPQLPRSHTDAAFSLAMQAEGVQLPVAVPTLGGTIDQLTFDATLRGAIPAGRLPQALAAWRDGGGTIELNKLDLDWGPLGATATGTLALDDALQPIGGFSGAVRGYDRIMTVLVQTGHMRASEAGLARLALAMLAKAGPDGRPEIETSFTIQNGEMYLGPAKLGPMPRIVWK
jgi:hypothetical protein